MIGHPRHSQAQTGSLLSPRTLFHNDFIFIHPPSFLHSLFCIFLVLVLSHHLSGCRLSLLQLGLIQHESSAAGHFLW